jgi:glutamate N-acetyltransferase/amino-acid N-acetyltransferase
MPIGYAGLPTLPAIDGVRLAAVPAGVKYADRLDLVLFELCPEASVAGVFTRNAFCAAPVTLCKQHMSQSRSRYWLINTGNANAGTGEQGDVDALNCCQALADAAKCDVHDVLPFSTGVIGEPLPVDKITQAVPSLMAALGDDNWSDAANGIMTTDTIAKGATRQLVLGDKTINFTGISKGSGMIRPNMATMLGYIATDAAVDEADLQAAFKRAVALSFNRVTVDGDTSTNDSCMLVATGRAGNDILCAGSDAFQAFEDMLTDICQELAQLIVRDGEGATKFIAVEVVEGINEVECEEVAYTIAHSPLVKTAFFASDPNWGRILAAVGRADVAGLNLQQVNIYLDDVCIVRQGGRADDYTEEQGQRVMDGEEITIRVELGRGDVSATVWTCDFSYDYVRINAEYRS